MKILMTLLGADFPPDPRVEKEARALLAADHQVLVVCENRHRRPVREWWNGIHILRLPYQPVWWRKLNTAALFFALRNPVWERHVRRVVAAEHPDALHVHDLPFVGPALRVASTRRLPVVADLHENYPAYVKARRPTTHNCLEWVAFDPRRFARYERAVLPRCHRVLVVVEEAAERVTQLGVDPDRIAVVGNAEDVEQVPPAFVPIALPPAALYIVYVGGVQALRGLQTAVAAMPRILARIPGALLVIVGDGLYRGALEAQARTLGVTARVRFEGHQPREAVYRYIRAADICIVPHLADELVNTTIPHKLFQYMFLGRPVVVSSARPLERIVADSQAGLVFASGDPDAFAGAVLELQNSDLRRRLGENGHRAVVAQYNWRFQSRILVDLYRDLAEAGGPRASHAVAPR